jgi:hypothetical protein
VRQRTLLFILVISLLLGNILTFSYILLHSEGTPTGKVQQYGIASFCINNAPTVSLNCNSTMSQNNSYTCQVNISDPDGQSVTVITNETAFINISSTGLINFTPNQSHVGNHTVLFIANDSSTCNNELGNTTYNFSVQNINDPPQLVRAIPDQQFAANTSLVAFFLTDYFLDPDGDLMTFNSSIPSTITVIITNSSLVSFSSASCPSSPELVTFTATDPYNASGESNVVQINVTCTQQSSSSSSGGASGGGGGGGGASFSCTPDYICEEWLSCLPTGYQWRHCFDHEGCAEPRFLKRSCEYTGPAPECKENWLCTDWGRCYVNGTQYRTCKDLKLCGSEIVKPPLSQQCLYIPSCNDNIKNGNETGVDCGGNCPACALVEQPLPLPPEGKLPIWLILSMLLSILLVSGALHYYRAQLAQAAAYLGFLLRRHRYKEVLLDATGRKALFERIEAFEQKKDLDTDERYTRLADLIRSYFADALDLKHESLPEEMLARCKELGINLETTRLLQGLYAKLQLLEEEHLEENAYFLQETVEELRTVVCITSDYTIAEIQRPIEELQISEQMSFYDEVFARSINALRAVQFNQVEAARKEYLTILTRYDPLSEAEKEQIYPELRWLFDAVKYQSEITGLHIIKHKAKAES